MLKDLQFSRRIQNLIADFRQLPHDTAQSILCKEQSVGHLFQNILKKYVKPSEVNLSDILLRYWPLIVGDVLSRSSAPRKVSPKGALIIKTQDSVVRQELFLKKDEILKNIYHFCPGNRIDDISFSL
ncbi:MAG: DUF721 domain-containing protein [Puniceicoccales bacterium]|jgi:hypothetical protein|nr:DUF721 domain-containing protein [Puniceicoccales bacterium]